MGIGVPEAHEPPNLLERVRLSYPLLGSRTALLHDNNKVNKVYWSYELQRSV